MIQGRGRPPVQNPQSELVAVYVSKEAKTNLVADAIANNITLSEIVRRAIAAHQKQESAAATAA